MKEIISEVMLHAATFIIFLMIFFFTFVCWVQKKAMVRDILAMIRGTIGQPPISTAGTEFNTPSAMQLEIDKLNDKVLIIVHTLVPGLVLALIVGAYFVAPSCFWHSVTNALWSLPFIAVAEFTIVGAFMYNYVELDQQTIVQIASNFVGGGKGTKDCNYVENELATFLPRSIVDVLFPPN